MASRPSLRGCEAVQGIPPEPPRGERVSRELDLAMPAVTLDGRLVLQARFNPGWLRLFGGGGVVFAGTAPLTLYGIGWIGRQGSIEFGFDVEWWKLYYGGDEIRVIWDEDTRTRERIGGWDRSVELRFLRISVRWAVGS